MEAVVTATAHVDDAAGAVAVSAVATAECGRQSRHPRSPRRRGVRRRSHPSAEPTAPGVPTTEAATAKVTAAETASAEVTASAPEVAAPSTEMPPNADASVAANMPSGAAMAAATSTDLNVLLIMTLSNVSPGGPSASVIEDWMICSNTDVLGRTR